MITETKLSKFLEKHFYLLLIIPLIFIAYALKDPGITISSDFPYLDTSDTAIDRLWMWNEKVSTDNFELAPRFPIIGIWYLLSFTSLSSEWATKIMILFGFVLSSISFYFSFLLFFRNRFTFLNIQLKISAIAASLFYTYNAWSFNRIHHWYLWIGYSILPLFFVSIFYSFRKPINWKYVACSALIWSIASTTPHITIFYAIIALGTFLAFIINNFRKKGSLVKLAVSLLGMFLIYTAVNMYWLYPYMVSFSSQVLAPNYEVSKENLDLLSRESNLLNTIRIFGYWINSNIINSVEHSSLYLAWLILSFVVPIVAFSSLLLRKLMKFIIILSCVALIGIFLAMGMQSPIDYYNIAITLPLISKFIWLFRDPDKWSIFIASSFSLLLGIVCYSVLFNITKAKVRDPRRLVVASLFIVLIVVSISVSSYPFYQDRMDALKPVIVPNEFDNLNRYLSSIDTDKVAFIPYPIRETDWHQSGPVQSIYQAHSIKPSIEGTEYNLAASNFYNFLENSVIKNRSKNIANLVHALGTSYLIFHNDTWSRGAGTYDRGNSYLLEKLLHLNDIKNIENIGFYNIFRTNNSQLNSSAGEVNIPSDNTLVVGGLDSFESLNTLLSFDTLKSSMIFLDSDPPKKMDFPWQSSDELIFDGQVSYDDLALSFTDDKYFVAPIFGTNRYDPAFAWSKSGTNDPINVEFHPLLRNLGIYNWDFDYGKGLVVTKYMGANLSIPIEYQQLDKKSKSGDTFELFMRFFENQKGGAVKIYLDGKLINQIDTYDKISNNFVWKKVGTINNTEGKHIITLQNVAGFNAVNVFAVIPAAEMNKISSMVSEVFTNKTQTVYLMEAESSFYNSKGNYTGSVEYPINENHTAAGKSLSGQFNVPLNSDLASIKLILKNNTNSLSSYHINDVKITPAKNKQNLYTVNFERNNIFTPLGALRQLNWRNYDKDILSTSLETEHPLNGNASLRVNLDAGQRAGWNILSTDFIPIDDNRYYSASLNLSANDVAQLHSRILYFDSQRKLIGDATDYIFRGKDGTFKDDFVSSILPPLHAEYLKIQVLTLSDNPKHSQYVLDDVKLDEIANPNSIIKDNLFVDLGHTHNQSLGKIINNLSGLNTIETEPFEVNPGQSYNYTIDTRVNSPTPISINVEFKNSSDVVPNLTYGNKASQGQVLSLSPGAEISSDLNIVNSANYTVALRAKTCDNCTFLRVDIFANGDDKKNQLIQSRDLAFNHNVSDFNWMQAEDIHLKQGKYKMNIYSNSSTDLDSVVVYSQNIQNMHAKSNKTYNEKLDVSENQQNPSQVYISDYKKVNPTKHIITIQNATSPYIVALAESYDPLWTAYAVEIDQDNTATSKHNYFKVNSIPLYGVTNGFYINKTGNYKLVIEYEPQKWFIQGAIISTISAIVAIIFLSILYLVRLKLLIRSYRQIVTRIRGR